MTPKKIVLFFILLVILPPTAKAKTADELRQIEQQLSQKQQQQAELDATARETSKGLDDLRTKLIIAARTLQDKETEEQNLADKIDDLTQEIAEKSKAAQKERAQLSLMVSALVEIASRPPATLFLQDRITNDHIHRSLLLQSILPRLKEQAETTARDLATLYEMQSDLAKQKELSIAAQENLQQQQHDLDQLIAARQGFLQRTESQKADIAKHLAELADKARDLRQLMTAVTPSHAPKPTGNASDSVALKWPVIGAIRKHFGDQDSDGVLSEGITLVGPSGAPVIASRDGKVVFAGPFRGYGLIVILQHEGGYHSFLSGFGRIDAEMGQDVAAGEPLGVLPVKAGTHPELYFEWRRGEQPIDPTGGLQKKS
jgi:septal ring factor EnvC (AmiA/AmiB activator)